MTNEQAITRQAHYSNETVRIELALRQQPQVDVHAKRISIIGHGFFGDLSVDLWGVIDRGELDLWDVALAGTTVSMSGAINGKQWDSLQDDAQADYDRQREAA